MPFVEDIILPVVPVGERSTIAACLLDWLRWLNDFINFARGSLALFPSELSFVCCCEVHSVGIDNLAFFLEIEGLLVGFDFRLGQFAVVVLAIVGEERFRVGVLDESVRAASHSGALVLIPGWQWIIYHQLSKAFRVS